LEKISTHLASKQIRNSNTRLPCLNYRAFAKVHNKGDNNHTTTTRYKWHWRAGRNPKRFGWPFDRPFDRLTVLSKVEGLTALSKVEGQFQILKIQMTKKNP
jgi:hypothetical protein